MKLSTTPGELKQAHRERLTREILSDKYIKLKVDREFDIKEDFSANKTKIYCKVHLTGSRTDSEFYIEGSGQGPVDAFFSSLSTQLSEHFCSLNTLRFYEFGASADLTRSEYSPSGSDAPVEVTLVVGNNLGKQFVFRNRSRSINRAAIETVLEAGQYFVNTEEAVITLHHAIVDAEKRNRGDLTDRYLMQLSTLVEDSCYQEAVAERTTKTDE